MKKYLAVWGYWDNECPAEYPPNYAEVEEAHFTTDMGYDESEIKEIRSIPIGGKWESKELGNHIVFRLS